jgi:lipopolysaccharide export system protein LptA
MARWQKQARWVLAVVAIGVAASVAYTLRPREPVAQPQKYERTDPKAAMEIHQGEAVTLKGANKDLQVEYRVMTTNQDGAAVLHDAKITVNNRGGRNYTVTGKQAFVGQKNSSYDIRGDVRLVTDDDLVVTSQQATYADSEKLVRVPGDVKFSRGRMSGSGIGFTFDEERDVMWILEKAAVDFKAEGNAGAMSFTSGTFGYARRERYMRFEQTMHMDREAQVMDADSAMVRLFPDRDEPDYVELRNGASVRGSGSASALKSMTARDINLDYADDGRSLQNATLAGKGEIQVASSASTSNQKLASDYMDINLDPADGSVRALSMRDAVNVTLPATKDTAARTVHSNALTAAGNQRGIREMKFSEGVEYREPGPKGQAGRTVRARDLVAGLDAAAGTIEDAHFVGNVDFTDGALHAVGSDARYMVDAGTLALTGVAPAPHIDSDTLVIDATTIDVTLNPRKMAAKGNVRSTLLPPKKSTGNQPAAKRPGLLDEKESVSVIADSLTYDETTRRAEYVGKPQAVLIQGQTTIHAASLTLDDTKGDLIANGKVLTNLVIASKQADGKETASQEPDTKEGKPAAKQKPTVARAETFTYSDQTRMATYTTAAQFYGDQGNLSAGKLELQLAKDENTLETIEANTAVTAIVDRRTVTGTRLTYSPSEDKYIVFGAPVKMTDADCKETSGKKLTFWKASDKVQVDGNNEVRTQTKGGGKCTVVPPQ